MSYLKVRQKGLGKDGIIALFPKINYIVVDGYNLRETDPYYYITEEVSKCMAKTYYPDILNYSKEDYDNGKYFARMGCRSRVNHEYQEDGKYAHYSRFNYGVVTLNLPQIALESLSEKNKIEAFFKILRERKSLMKKAFQQRFDFVKNLKVKKAPILFQYGAIARLNPEDTIEPLLRTDRSSLSYGYLGIDDCVRILTNDKNNISDKKGKALGLRIAKELSKQAKELKEELKLPISVYGSPVEAGIHSIFQADLKNYENVMPNWLKDRQYYTNSFHFSSELDIDCFDKIDTEADFVPYADGGNIMYVENGGKVANDKAIVELIQYAYEKGIQYFAVNTVSDKCFECGYVGEISYDENKAKYTCPQCGNESGLKMKIHRRSCGSR